MKERIILGLGDNVDYEVVWNSGAIENLVMQYGIHNEELSTNKKINCERDLVISILGFLQSGDGGERFVFESDIIEQFAQKFSNKITIGGTSVRAAIAMRKLGYTSALHLVTANDHVRRLIPQDSPYVCSNTKDTSYPHLIIQFGKGTRVQAGDIDICTSRANRIIYDNDYDNIMMFLNEDFSSLITDAKVFMISGFNAMQDQDLLADRLKTILKIMTKLPEDALVYFEDACYYNPSFTKLVHASLVKHIDIYSLNEDELQLYLGRKLDLLDAVQMKQAMEDIQKLIPVPLIVVHSMYWALAFGNNATSLAKALKGGITMATTRYRFGDDFTVENYKETENLPPNQEGKIFAAELKNLLGDKVYCEPVVHDNVTNPTTIGLGDAFVGGFLPVLAS